MPRMTAHCALSGIKMHLYQRVIRSLGPASAAPPGNHAECRVCAGWRLTPYPAYIIWRRVRPFAGPASAAPPGNHIECHVCAGWRLTPYLAYVIWRRVRPFAGPASAAPPGNIHGTVPRLCRMAADALSGLRYLAPGSPPSQARQAQRRRAITPSAAFVPDGG